MSIYEEIRNMNHLTPIGIALVKYATSLESGLEFKNRHGRWVPIGTKNFVTFEFHWKTTLSIRISLRGNPQEHLHHDDLKIKAGMAGYSECTVTTDRHLMPASIAIWRAHQLYNRGRNRSKKELYLVENKNNKWDSWLPPKPQDPEFWCGTPHLSELSDWYKKVEEFASNNGLVLHHVAD